METRPRRCVVCSHLNPPTAEFCAECGEFLDRVTPTGLARARQTQFTLPDYLLVAREREREERRRQLAHQTGQGIGTFITGALVCGLALWFGGGGQLGLIGFGFGLLLLLGGLWQLRRDTQNMARVGLAALTVSSVVVGAALMQTIGPIDAPESQPVASVAQPETTETPERAAPSETYGGAMPMYRGNAARTGENPGPGPATRPLVAWKAFVGGESYASPVVGLGDVFVATKSGAVVALSLQDGTEQWSVDVDEYVARSTPAFDGETLFVTGGYAIVAVDAISGAEVWRKPLRFAGSCSPVVDDDRVYAAAQEGAVTAFAKATGEELWHYANGDLIFSSPSLADGTLVIADVSGQVTALNAETGRKAWQTRLRAEVHATPAIVGDQVFVVTTTPEVIVLDLDTGGEVWRAEAGGPSSPAVADGTVYVGGEDQAVRALDASNGEERWSTPLGYPIASSPASSGDLVYVASGPTITALDAESGQTVWGHVAGDVITADVAVVDGMVIASGHDGYVYALRANVRESGPMRPAA
ncbi:MAG: PQQ-binding-like beta-propeller repeat protein [Thermomicrobiales bacterium]|nr:PQQ-binding-like beta-propeller repeat protein [Thermomicrobiales bacterium]